MDKSIILLRGVPGSGKSTFAKNISNQYKYPVFSIDDYFTDENGIYKFDYSKNHLAYTHCQIRTKEAMQRAVEKIIVDNTFIFDWEMKPYFALAKEFDYQLFSVILENYHGHTNLHQIAQADVEKMAAKLKPKLY